jgi:phage protein D
MTTEASRRLHLHDTARQTWGKEAANTLMELLPPEPDVLATKADVALLRSDLRSEMADLRTARRSELTDLRCGMADIKAEMRVEMADFKAEIHQAFAEQTRTLVLANAGMMLTTLALSFAVARIG